MGKSYLWLENREAKQRASEGAARNLKTALAHAVDPVACPACGWYQEAMVKILRHSRVRVPIEIGVAVAIVVAIGVAALITTCGFSSYSTLSNGERFVRGVLGGAATGILIACSVAVGATARWMKNHPNACHPGLGGKHAERARSSQGILRRELEAKRDAEKQGTRQLFNTTLRDTLMFVVSSDGDVNESEVTRLCEIYEQVTDIELDMNSIRRQCEASAIDPDKIGRRLHVLSDQLQPEGKAVFIQAALFIAAADEEFDVGERAAISFIAAALDMTQEEFDAAVQQVAKTS
jgi:uncharacterized tellurite resistance protein B-like protein